MENKHYKYIIIVLLSVLSSIYIYTIYFTFSNTHLTQAQVFLELWELYITEIVLMLTAVYIYYNKYKL